MNVPLTNLKFFVAVQVSMDLWFFVNNFSHFSFLRVELEYFTSSEKVQLNRKFFRFSYKKHGLILVFCFRIFIPNATLLWNFPNVFYSFVKTRIPDKTYRAILELLDVIPLNSLMTCKCGILFYFTFISKEMEILFLKQHLIRFTFHTVIF